MLAHKNAAPQKIALVLLDAKHEIKGHWFLQSTECTIPAELHCCNGCMNGKHDFSRCDATTISCVCAGTIRSCDRSSSQSPPPTQRSHLLQHAELHSSTDADSTPWRPVHDKRIPQHRRRASGPAALPSHMSRPPNKRACYWNGRPTAALAP